MKKIGLILCAILVASCQQGKIGYVDTVELMEKSKEKIDIEAKFQIKSTSLNKKRDSISQAFQLEAQALQAKTSSMTQKKAQEEYELLQQRGQFIGQQLQQEEQQLQLQGQAEMDSLVSKVKREISTYGEANGFAYILGAGEGGTVLYGQEKQDLTEIILKIVNENYNK